ncbi:MAG: CopG family antitoxin [Candidatus Binataceae bacterium]
MIVVEQREFPRFDHEDEEREFWTTHDSAELIDWRAVRRLDLSKLRNASPRRRENPTDR